MFVSATYILMMLLAAGIVSSLFCLETSAQTEPRKPQKDLPITGSDLGIGDDLSEQASKTEATSEYFTNSQQDTTTVQQLAEQNKDGGSLRGSQPLPEPGKCAEVEGGSAVQSLPGRAPAIRSGTRQSGWLNCLSFRN